MESKALEKPALEFLLDCNLFDLVSSMAMNFYMCYGINNSRSTMITQEDLTREGIVGAVVAYESFDPNRGFTDNMIKSFRTYAYPYIKNAMSTFCRKFSSSLSISEKAARYDFASVKDAGIVYIDQLEEEEEFDIPVGSGFDDSRDVSEHLFAGCTKIERDLVIDHIINDFSLQELSEKHHLSKSRAREIVKCTLGRMKERAEQHVKDYQR